MKMTSDPATYRKLCEPFGSVEAANERIQEFFSELGELREKYGLPDVLCVIQSAVIYEDGQEGSPIGLISLGDRTKAPILAAYALADTQKSVEAIIGQLLKGA